ncbi:hypothetical protein I6H96_02655 [Brucella anthropi]|uniref:Uncharacterized protein n=1 Tax=Brucella anthropi (strain ATCC 49188 / DSM 6882 / CCUG 24695 / JCM 21032 / LMG 3331 / NBRC 15819 / NCTC 12168 / Alc 37) TaxID=439375 RepID=A6WZ48_BRUA4|nr:hypothetical protein [Brucella anthropi]ABS14252.1 hypothetical protein Oant_1536 [Brucella anthropi ATCC 49188]NKC48139.1 hypothetical protein [Brucella anthropi ATCC 49188]QQC25781.1 hypothetical protein I6H96_02655 [Brucella anthropi]SUA65450.1 Uncharacterised protein [Brucella anthropi]
MDAEANEINDAPNNQEAEREPDQAPPPEEKKPITVSEMVEVLTNDVVNRRADFRVYERQGFPISPDAIRSNEVKWACAILLERLIPVFPEIRKLLQSNSRKKN